MASSSTGVSTRCGCIGRRSSQAEIQTDMANPVTPKPERGKARHHCSCGSVDRRQEAQSTSPTRRQAISTGVDHVHFQVNTDPVNIDLTLTRQLLHRRPCRITHAERVAGSKRPQQDRWHRRRSGAFLECRRSCRSQYRPPSPSRRRTSGATISGNVSCPQRTPPTTSASTACNSSSTERHSDSKISPPPIRGNWNTTLSRQRHTCGDGHRARRCRRQTTSTSVTVDRRQQRRRSRSGRPSTSPHDAADHPDPHEHAPQREASDLRQRDHSDSTRAFWDPVTNTFTQTPYNDSANLFCARHTPLPDGRILVVGGHIDAYVGLKNTTIFDPATNTWADVQPMTNARWYPTAHQASRRSHARRLPLRATALTA